MNVRLRIGGFTLAIRSKRPLPALEPPARARPFETRSRANVSIDIEVARPPEPSRLEPLFDSGGLWQVHQHGHRLLYRFHAPVGFDGTVMACSVDAGRRRGRLHLDPRFARLRGLVFAYPLDELLLQHHAARSGAFVLHACGVRHRGRVLLFCGESGAGKTTLARLWRRHRREAEVLSDDRIVVRASDPLITAWGTPWHGSGRHASPDGGRLDAIFFLEQAEASGTTRVAGADAVASLFARTFPPPWEAMGMARVLRACARVERRVPFFRLRFRPDASALRAIEAALR